MATLPESAGFGTELVLASQPSLTWLIDKEQNQVSRMDEGLEAVRQAVEIALSVERFRWQIYSTNFGAELDDLIGKTAKGWSTDRMSLVDLTVLRLAVWEILYNPEIPDSVSVAEALELTELYSDPEDKPFVNGILGTIVRGKTV